MPFPYRFTASLPGPATLTQPDDPGTPDHVEAMLNRLAEYLRRKDNVEKLLTALSSVGEGLRQALEDLKTKRTLADAEGAQLDMLGAIIGQAREGDSDTSYRARIKAGVKLNNCSGTVEEIYEVFSLVLPEGVTMELHEQGGTAFVLRLFGDLLTYTEVTRFIRFLRKARAGGVRGMLEHLNADPADTFTLDGTADQALDAGVFADALI